MENARRRRVQEKAVHQMGIGLTGGPLALLRDQGDGDQGDGDQGKDHDQPDQHALAAATAGAVGVLSRRGHAGNPGGDYFLAMRRTWATRTSISSSVTPSMGFIRVLPFSLLMPSRMALTASASVKAA